MSDELIKSSKTILDPSERIAEVLFGLIMVLTFTGSLSIAEAGREDIRTMLIGALGCNLAWGIIDGVFYLMGCLAEKGRGIRTLSGVQNADSPQAAHQIISGALPAVVAAVLSAEDLEKLRQRLSQLPKPPTAARLSSGEIKGALAVFLWVFITTFPVAVPFIVMKDAALAMRASNAVATLLLFIAGCAFGGTAGFKPWISGLSMILLGSMLVALTIALGG